MFDALVSYDWKKPLSVTFPLSTACLLLWSVIWRRKHMLASWDPGIWLSGPGAKAAQLGPWRRGSQRHSGAPWPQPALSWALAELWPLPCPSPATGWFCTPDPGAEHTSGLTWMLSGVLWSRQNQKQTLVFLQDNACISSACKVLLCNRRMFWWSP